ncbi:MAG: sugar isomerase domain-containing protein [Armatimonadota bacterium]
MSAESYFQAARHGLQKLQGELQNIHAAAKMFTDAIEAGNTLFAFGATHSFILPMEMCYRTGGLMLVNPIYPHGMDLTVRPMSLTSQIERVPDLGRLLVRKSPAQKDDVLLIASTSGRNHVVVEMAMEAAEMGIQTIGVTAVEYSSAVESRHPSGKKLMDLCDVVIDNCSPEGDAAVGFEGFKQKSGPLSTVLGCTVVNAIVCETIQMLLDRGITPPVYMSANMPGGDEHNDRLLAENEDRIHYD